MGKLGAPQLQPTTVNQPVTKLEYLENLQGIDETVDVLDFLAQIGRAVKLSLDDDGVITAGDMLKFISPLTALPSAITGITKVPLELADELTDDEKHKLLAVVVSSGVLPEEAIDAVDDALEVAELLKRFILKYFIKD